MKWEDNIEMEFMILGFRNVDRFQLDQDHVQM
jgi:hypothetical protein